MISLHIHVEKHWPQALNLGSPPGVGNGAWIQRGPLVEKEMIRQLWLQKTRHELIYPLFVTTRKRTAAISQGSLSCRPLVKKSKSILLNFNSVNNHNSHLLLSLLCHLLNTVLKMWAGLTLDD